MAPDARKRDREQKELAAVSSVVADSPIPMVGRPKAAARQFGMSRSRLAANSSPCSANPAVRRVRLTARAARVIGQIHAPGSRTVGIDNHPAVSDSGGVPSNAPDKQVTNGVVEANQYQKG